MINCANPLNSVYVISSLPRKIIESMIGHIKNLCIFAEDGYQYIGHNTEIEHKRKWRPVCGPSSDCSEWKKTVYETMSSFNQKTDFATILSAPSSLTFQTIMVFGKLAETQSRELYNILSEKVKEYPNVEVRMLKNIDLIVESNSLPKVSFLIIL